MKKTTFIYSLFLFSLVYNTVVAKIINLIPYTTTCYNNDTLHYTKTNINQLGFLKGIVRVKLNMPLDFINEMSDDNYIKIDFPFIDSFTVKSAGLQLYKLGDAFPFKQRPIDNKAFIFPITKKICADGVEFTVYCNGEYSRFPMQYGTLSELTQNTTIDLVLGAYNGIIIFAFFLSLFILYSLREKVYVWYLLFLSATFIFQLSTEGLAYPYLWPTASWWANHVIPFSGVLALLLLVMFTQEMFKSNESKTLNKIYLVIKIILASFAMLALLPNPMYSISLVDASVASIVINLFLLKIGIYNYVKKHPQSYYYSVAFGSLLVAIIVSQLTYNNILPLNILTNNIMLVGSGTQILLLSLGLTQKINYFRSQEQLAQAALLLQLTKQTEEQQKANELLEMKVQERTDELQLQTQALEQLNTDHTQSVTYASYIQSSLLPAMSLIKEKLKQSFILYAPRDIVSGDFYWYCDTHTSGNISTNLQVLCAVDCTGHGVPGAFMSLVANNLLNLTVKDTSVNSPADVIAFLNTNLAKAMNRQNGDKTINDGMDIIVCAYEPITKTLYYAGANRPLYIVKHNTLQLVEIKPVKVSVGGYTPITQQWENTTVQLEEGDCFYLSSDGYADQFGGEKDKKITTKRLKELLVQIHPQTMEQQEFTLYNYLTTWQGNRKQIDDVMLIGVRV